MKNIILYYLAILLPIPFMVVFSENSIMFISLFVAYLFYRGFVDGQRLIEKNIIDKSELWKVFIPFWHSQFYRQLYFEK